VIISFYAGILAFVYIAMSFYVIRGRFVNRISIGHAGNDDMARRMRMHGNFIEYVPFALFLLFLAEYQGANDLFIHALGILLTTGRLMHPIGILKAEGPSVFRAGGMVLTFLAILIAAILCIAASFTGYQH
jgi:uncharacterized membrane protein YecN with MAPEG domain